MELHGIYVPITTPFKEEEFYPTGLQNNLARWNQYPLTGYIVLGSTGEAVMLSDQEKLTVVETARQSIPDQKQMIVGSMYHSLASSVEFINRCAALGVQAALVLPPHYYRTAMTPERLVDFYRRLADQSKIPILIYHFPKVSGITLSAEVVLKLADHPNIIGIKDSSANVVFQQTLIAESPSSFSVLTGSASTLTLSCIAGATGGIVALGNIASQHCLDIFRAVKSGNIEDARKIQLAVNRLNLLTTAVYGIGGLKYAMDRLGYYGGLPRLPLTLPSESGKTEIDRELKQLQLIPS